MKLRIVTKHKSESAKRVSTPLSRKLSKEAKKRNKSATKISVKKDSKKSEYTKEEIKQYKSTLTIARNLAKDINKDSAKVLEILTEIPKTIEDIDLIMRKLNKLDISDTLPDVYSLINDIYVDLELDLED